ncbi:hypothetical protein [Ralstonia wenshanensis]|uniref:hypothetical protein n=1 Tax=Ralstonia wenshanensis TaxID=2842456 RepID=UPI0021B39ECA|nr:hypothetical protein [Ralstonia wenshanensis]MCT7307965.1 hypothetical protein [Ralstonia wenshanensis]
MAKKHLTFHELCSLSLLNQALWHEERRHALRMAEIQKMEKALGALEAERAAIERNGYRLFGDNIFRDLATSTLRYSGILSSDDIRLASALLRAGWKVVERGTGQFPSPRFKKGRLKLTLSCLNAGALEQAEQRVAAAPTVEAA